MADNSTVARPYARAVFEHACAERALATWSDILNALSQVISMPEVGDFLENPEVSLAMQHDLLLSLFGPEMAGATSTTISHLIHVLAHNKRLPIMTEIWVQYESMRADHEKTLAVVVRSYDKLSAAAEHKISVALKARLQREIKLHVSVDPSLMGGAVITAGDLVIDGSVRGKLNQLQAELLA